MQSVSRLVLLSISLVISSVVLACKHSGTTSKCLLCLRENYMSYGREKATTICDPRNCPLAQRGTKSLLSLENHKHCGKHGSLVTLTQECPECRKEEAQQHWQEAEMAKQEDTVFKKMGIPLPGYRDGSSARKEQMIGRLQYKIAQIEQRIEDYEDKMFQPNMSEASLKILEKKISELKFVRDVYFRALEQWEAVANQTL